MNDIETRLKEIKKTRASLTVEERAEEMLSKTYGFAKLMTYYKCAMMEIETKFNVLNEEFSLQFDRQPISYIKTRLKNPISIYTKLLRKNFPVSLKDMEDNINDIAGIRVVCSFIDDVYMLAEALLKQDDITLIEKKDYIAEIQLRTIAMDFWASLEHQLKYKKDVDFTDDMLEELKDCASASADLDRRMAILRKKCMSENKNTGGDFQ